jgi:DNA-binding transcriptional ArsR family regulator
MPNNSPSLDEVFHSLSDPTRRSVLERLSSGPATVSQLAKEFQISLPSFLQHLSVLESCNLVRSSKKGRVRTFEIQTKSLKEAEVWLSEQRIFWEKRLNQLDNFLRSQKEKNK